MPLDSLHAMGDEGGLLPGEYALSGSAVSAATARRLGCDAAVTGIVIAPDGQVLNVGREQRTVTAAQWVALVARDGGCAFPGCTRPSEWCDAHHIIWWAHGGGTDLHNLILLCRHHHRRVHHHGWDIQIGTDGRAEFLPPAWINPSRTPRRNTRPRPHHHWTRAIGQGPVLDIR